MSTTVRIPRTISVAAASASKEEIIRPMVLLELGFDTSPIRFNSSNIHVYWDNKEWYGVGDAGKVGSVREGISMESHGLSVSISGIPTEYISLSLGDNIQGRPILLYLALFDENSHLIKDPVPLGPWRMDTMSIRIGETAEITLQNESRMAHWNRAKVKRYTHEEQITRYPGDMGLEFIAAMVNLDFNWGEGENDKNIPYGMWGGS